VVDIIGSFILVTIGASVAEFTNRSTCMGWHVSLHDVGNTSQQAPTWVRWGALDVWQIIILNRACLVVFLNMLKSLIISCTTVYRGVFLWSESTWFNDGLLILGPVQRGIRFHVVSSSEFETFGLRTFKSPMQEAQNRLTSCKSSVNTEGKHPALKTAPVYPASLNRLVSDPIRPPPGETLIEPKIGNLLRSSLLTGGNATDTPSWLSSDEGDDWMVTKTLAGSCPTMSVQFRHYGRP
jgi:hypothetical protein